MRHSMLRRLGALALLLGLFLPALQAVAANGDTLVTIGSPPTPFSQNKQNEPAVAIDAHMPNVVAAGSNDNIDLEACNAGDPTTCPFTEGVGVSGIYFSFDGGKSWTQPTYTGLTARDCLGPEPCTPHVGPIGTLPWYYESGLASDGDPALAFGPRPDASGHFSWDNGSRLYYANLTSNLSAERKLETFRGFEAIAVSRTDDVQAAANNDKGAWMRPVIVSRQSSATFSDKEQIWADNAASSPFFGNVYICWASFVSVPGHAQPLIVARSTDGGDTWNQKQVTQASNNLQHFGRSGCTIRTDSHGVVYVFYEEFNSFSLANLPPHGSHMMVKSFDGGVTWTRPQKVRDITDPCFFFDPVEGRCVFDGLAGARDDLSASPSVDIANGAPTGADATNLIVDVWSDGRDGLNHEKTLVSWSSDGGATWSRPVVASEAGDRTMYSAPALSPDGKDLYVVYMGYTTPFRDTTSGARTLLGVVRHADVTGGGPGSFATLHRGQPGDARGSSANSLAFEFLGDYVYAAATRDYGVAVWTDVRDAADCPAIDAWRQSLYTDSPLPRPAPQRDCPATFGNTDIFGGQYAP